MEKVQQNLKDVIRNANAEATSKGQSVGVCWDQEDSKWEIYDLQAGIGPGKEAELICFGSGVMPIALTPTALEALTCALQEVINDWDRKQDLTKEQSCLLKQNI